MFSLGPQSGEAALACLAAKIPQYNAAGNTVVLQRNPLAVLVLTPIMQRAHRLPSASEIVFCDSASCCDRGGHILTFLMALSPVGGVPLAVFITDSTTKESYIAAFNLLVEALGDDAFCGRSCGPQIFMTDDSDPERDALDYVWRGSILLLCIFHVAQAVWRWLWDARHEIAKDDRQKLMSDFLALLRCTSREEAPLLYEKCCDAEVSKKYPNYLAYLKKYWDRKLDWCLAYR